MNTSDIIIPSIESVRNTGAMPNLRNNAKFAFIRPELDEQLPDDWTVTDAHDGFLQLKPTNEPAANWQVAMDAQVTICWETKPPGNHPDPHLGRTWSLFTPGAKLSNTNRPANYRNAWEVLDAADGFLHLQDVDNPNTKVLMDAAMTVAWACMSPGNPVPQRRRWSHFLPGMTITCLPLQTRPHNVYLGLRTPNKQPVDGWLDCNEFSLVGGKWAAIGRWLVPDGQLAGTYAVPAGWKVL